MQCLTDGIRGTPPLPDLPPFLDSLALGPDNKRFASHSGSNKERFGGVNCKSCGSLD